MYANPAIEVLKKQANLLLMPLFSAAVYSSFGLLITDDLLQPDQWFYWPVFTFLFFVQVLCVSSLVQMIDLASVYLSVHIQMLRPALGLTALTIGLIPLSGLATGEVGNLLWPIAMLTFGFHMFNDDFRPLGKG